METGSNSAGILLVGVLINGSVGVTGGGTIGVGSFGVLVHEQRTNNPNIDNVKSDFFLYISYFLLYKVCQKYT